MRLIFSKQVLVCAYTICQYDQVLISCTISNGSPFPPDHAYSCITFGAFTYVINCLFLVIILPTNWIFFCVLIIIWFCVFLWYYIMLLLLSRGSISLLRFSFVSHVHVITCAISVVFAWSIHRGDFIPIVVSWLLLLLFYSFPFLLLFLAVVISLSLLFFLYSVDIAVVGCCNQSFSAFFLYSVDIAVVDCCNQSLCSFFLYSVDIAVVDNYNQSFFVLFSIFCWYCCCWLL